MLKRYSSTAEELTDLRRIEFLKAGREDLLFEYFNQDAPRELEYCGIPYENDI